MALALNNFTGFETQGAEESSALVGTPTYPTTDVRSGSACLLLDAVSESYDLPWQSASAGPYIIGIAVKFASTTADATGFIQVCDAVEDTTLTIRVGSGNVIEVADAGGTVRITSTGTVGTTNYHYIELFFENLNTADGELFIDGVSEGTTSTADFLAAGLNANADLVFFYDGTNTIRVDDAYILSGATAASDRLGGSSISEMPEVFGYQAGNTGTSSDRQVGGTGGSTLDAGTWDKAGETPGATTTTNPEYTDAGDGAVDCDDISGRQGPSGDSNIDGDSNIKAIKGIWTMQRSGGGASDHFGLLGNTGDHVFRSADLDPTQSFDNYFFVSEGTPVPLSTEFCAIGFETTGAQDFECQEMWAMLLHVPAAVATEDTDPYWIAGGQQQPRFDPPEVVGY